MYVLRGFFLKIYDKDIKSLHYLCISKAALLTKNR